jgi:drug/metabolite transporter (DMT)-like permease
VVTLAAAMDRRADSPALAYGLLALAALFWSGVFVVGRGTHEDVPPMALAFLRYAFAILVMVPLVWRPLRRELPKLKACWPWLLAFGVINIALFPILTLLALARTTAVNAALINSLQPVMIVALAFLAYGERITARQALGVAVSLAGILAIVTEGKPALILGLALNSGDLMVMLALFIWSVYSVTMRRLPPLDPYVLVFAQMVLGAPFAAPFFAAEALGGRVPTWDATTILALLYFATLPSIFAFSFWNRGVLAVGPAKAGMFIHLIPVFGIVLAVITLGETLYPYHAAGAGLVVVGIWLATARRLMPWRRAP